ncbi:MAG: M56 family metallopeptidase [Vicinamibacterales bacterium]
MDLVLRTSAILAATWLAARLLTRASAATRHLLWHTAVVVVLAAPLVSPLAPGFAVPGLAAALGATARTAGMPNLLARGLSRADGAGRSSPGTPVPATNATDMSSATLDPATNLPIGRRDGLTSWPWAGASWLWAGGTVAVGGWFLIGWVLALRTARRASDAPAAWQTEAAAIAARLSIAGDIRLGMLRTDSSPLTVGLVKPHVLLPPSAASWDTEHRHAVLVHELAHVRRRDPRSQLTVQVACAMYWFNPLIWVAARALRRERERACDDEVLQSGAVPSAYAACLLGVAQLVRRHRASAALAMARSSDLEGRLLALLDDRARQPSRAGRALAPGIVALGAAAALGATPVDMHQPLAAKPFARGSASTWAMLLPDEPRLDREIIEHATTTLRTSPDAGAREKAALALAQGEAASSVAILTAALSDPSSGVREHAALALAVQSGPHVVEPLIRALHDPDSQVREKAAIGLALRRDPRVVTALLEAIQDPDAQVREKAAIALATSGDTRARAPLEAATRDSDAQVREKAVAGLMLLSAPVSSEDDERLRRGLRGLSGMLMRMVP